MEQDLARRFLALAGAHNLIRPRGTAGLRSALLSDLFGVFLGPYDTKGVIGDRIRVSSPEIVVGESGAITLALVVHELATNSAKYGSLSASTGIIDIVCVEDHDDIEVAWRERCGRPIAPPAGPGGFGTRLVSRSVSGSLGGSMAFQWLAEGVVITIRMNKARLLL